MLKILIRPGAQKDTKKIWHYTYKNWGEKQADSYTEALGLSIKSLINNPEIGMTIDHVREGYRLFHYKKHFIIYRLTSKAIDVVRVLGEQMDIKRHL